MSAGATKKEMCHFCVTTHKRDVLFICTGPLEEIISGAKIVSQLYTVAYTSVNLASQASSKTRRLLPKSSSSSLSLTTPSTTSLSVVIRLILFLSPRRKDFESSFACPACSIRPIQNAKCTSKSQKSIFCRRRPRLISRPISRACNVAYFYPWPTSPRRNTTSLLFGHSRNRTRKKQETCGRREKTKLRSMTEICKPISSISHSTPMLRCARLF